jgi:hypothetical protein
MDDAERKNLKDFLDEFVELIDDVLSDEQAHWFPRDLVGPMRRAWKNEVSRKIDAIKSAIDAPQNQTAFDDAGLTGDQLKFKLAAWRYAKEAAQKRPLSKRRRTWRQAVLSWLGFALRPLQGALKIANAILESIGIGFRALTRCRSSRRSLRLARPPRRARTRSEAHVPVSAPLPSIVNGDRGRRSRAVHLDRAQAARASQSGCAPPVCNKLDESTSRNRGHYGNGAGSRGEGSLRSRAALGCQPPVNNRSAVLEAVVAAIREVSNHWVVPDRHHQPSRRHGQRPSPVVTGGALRGVFPPGKT